MFCPKCGANLPEGSIFCPSCGFNLSSGFDSPAENVVYPLDKAKKILSDPLFLAIAILLSAAVGAGFLGGGFDILLGLIVAGVWMAYAGVNGENTSLIGKGITLTSVIVKVQYVIVYVAVGIVLFCGLIVFLLFSSLGNSLAELGSYTFETFEQAAADMGFYIEATAEEIDYFNKIFAFFSSLSGFALGAIFFGITAFFSAVAVLFNVLFTGRFAKFLKNASLAVKEGRTVELGDRRCAGWLMAYGIIMAVDAVSTFATLGSIFGLIVAGCTAGPGTVETPNPSQPSEPEASTTQPEPTAPTWQMGIGAPIGFDTNTVVASVFPEVDYGNGYPIALIINSKAGIEAHLSRLGYPEYLEILEAVEAYDDTFFESHSLILVWNPPGSSSDAYRVNSLHRIAEDEIEIGMCKEIPSEGAQDLVSKLIFVETSKKIPEKTVCNVNCSAHRGQKPPQVSLVDSEQVIKPRLRGYGWTNNCGSIYADGGFIGKDTNYEEEYPWLYTSQRSVLLESPVAPQKISVECWDVSNWGSDPFKIQPEKLKVENGSIPLKIGTYFYAVTVEWSVRYTDREFGGGEAYYGFVAHVSDESDNDQPTKPVEDVFNTRNIVRITFYAYYGGGKGSDVPAENMAEIINWLNSFAVGEKAPDLLPPGTGTWQVEIEYADGTIVKRSLDTITIDGDIYYLHSDPQPEILKRIMSMFFQ